MTTIAGRSERHKDRSLDVQLSADGRVRIHIFHPVGRSGAATGVALPDLREALERTGPTELITLGPGPLYVQRRGSEVYFWIQNVGKNGWSIYVDGERLDAALAAAPAASSLRSHDTGVVRVVWIIVIAFGCMFGLGAACIALS